MRKAMIFINREGVILKNTKLKKFEDIDYISNVFTSLNLLKMKGNFEFTLISSFDKSIEIENQINQKIVDTLNNQAIKLSDNIIISNNEDKEDAISSLLTSSIIKEQSIIISNKLEDLKIANKLNIKSIFFEEEKNSANYSFFEVKESLLASCNNWLEISNLLVNGENKLDRVATINRKTKETDISLFVNLDGQGKGTIKTGLAFFDHMLEQIMRHSGLDISLTCNGDLDVDEHHSVEDVAIVLGEAIKKALSDKRGISRYGFNILTMDEVKATCALDFSSRPYFKWSVPFKREYVGNFPTELFEHFFKSFSDAAACNLHIEVNEGNTHHMVEAIFKCFAKAVKEGVYRYPYSNELPSTKGLL